LNRRPADYESAALPLSYAGLIDEPLFIMRLYGWSRANSNRVKIPQTGPFGSDFVIPCSILIIFLMPIIGMFEIIAQFSFSGVRKVLENG
jgi:hypothetical protein